MTATLVWEYRHVPALNSPTRGSATRLANGNTIVAFGVSGIVVEVDASRAKVWQGTLTVGGVVTAFYRVTPIASLYHYQAP